MHVSTRNLLSVVVLFATVSLPVLANPAPLPRPTEFYPVEIIHQFPLGTWVENLAVRSNGQILATILSSPELYQVDPQGKRDPFLIHTFPNATGLVGITELGRDKFYVVAITANLETGTFEPGSSSVWEVNLRPFSIHHGTPAAVVKVANFPDALLLNGIAPFNRKRHTVLIADSLAGVIYRFNVRTGESRIVIDEPLLKGSIDPFAIGVNGLNLDGLNLYFSNTRLQIVARQLLNRDASPRGNPVVVVNATSSIDDFALGPNGDYFIAQSPYLSYAPTTTGDVISLARNISMPDLIGATAVRFGRKFKDIHNVYVSTSGGIPQYLSGELTLGGSVNKVHVSRFLGSG